MRIKILAEGKFIIAAVMNGKECPVYDELTSKLPPQYKINARALLMLLDRLSSEGFQSFGSNLIHEISKKEKIYQLVKGDLRLIFFHGDKQMIVVCTEVIIKKTQKADRSIVKRSAELRNLYYQSIESNCLYEIRE